jgi:HK97 family phage portal protein
VKVLTSSGRYQSVDQRSWPLAGVDLPRPTSSAYSALPMARLPTGEARLMSLQRIYRSNPLVFACSNLLAKGLSTLPLKTLQLDADGQHHRVRGDLPNQQGRPSAGARLDNLMRYPAPLQSRRKLIYKSVIDQCVYGDALWSVQKGQDGPSELWHVPWRKVQVNEGDTTPVVMYEVKGTRGTRSLMPEDVVHFSWGADPESQVSTSPLEACQYTIALMEAINRHLINYYGNRARPSGIFKVQRMPDDKALAKMREMLKQLYTAPENAGNVLITSAEFQPIAEETGVPTLVELIKLSREEVCMVYGTPPPMVGLLERAIKANVAELREMYLRDGIGPWAISYEMEMMTQLVNPVPTWQYHVLQFDINERLRPALEQRAQTYRNLAGVYTPNEMRGDENLDRIESAEADRPWMPSGTIPLGLGVPTTVSDITVDPADLVEPDPDDGGDTDNPGELDD